VARTNVTVALRSHGIAQPTVDDARIVVSELMGNALRHAQPLTSGGLTVGIEVGADSVRIWVSDGGSATLPTLVSPPVMSPSGRGLSIVRTLTRSWGVQERPSGNTVFGVLARQP
jgi:anti-sigma regulatory factor (Ser/Thr protein kinase)